MSAEHTRISLVAALAVALIATSASAGMRYTSSPAGVPTPAPVGHLSPSSQPLDIFGAVANLAGSILDTAGGAIDAVWPGSEQAVVAKPDPNRNPSPEALDNSPGK